VVVDSAWVEIDESREADYETAFGRLRQLPAVHVTVKQLAGAL
jgi:hypothetical protein